MARPLTWTDVRGGLIALGIIVAAAVGILKFLRVGAMHGRTVHVYALVGEAGGLTTGSEVWLSGQKVGTVSRIEFRPVETDTAKRVLIDMQVLAKHLPAIHRDATAQIRTGGSLIGAIVIYLSPGTTRAAELADGDTIAAKGSGVLEGMRDRASVALREVPAIMSNVHALAGELQATHGTIGAAMNGPGLRTLQETRLRTVGVMNRLHGRGTAALIMEGGLSAHAGHVMARVDSVRALLASNRTSLGRLRRDSTLMTEVADIRRELAQVQASLDEPRGTAGRMMRDSGISNALAGAQQQMTLLFADLNAHPFRYIRF